MADSLQSNIPIPDPSLLTTEQLRRELAALREILEARMAGMDKTHSLLEQQVQQAVSVRQGELLHLKELHNERFRSVEKQFVERDERSKAAEQAAQVAVGAALQAQKEAAIAQNQSNTSAIAKAESATVKQIDGILALLDSNTKAIDDKIVVINGRLDRGEGSQQADYRHTNETRLNIGAIMGVIGGILAAMTFVAMLVFTVVSYQHSSTGPTTYVPVAPK